jgi:hypothetical protein
MSKDDKEVFMIEIMYKSGNSKTFLCNGITIHNHEVNWNNIQDATRPIVIGVDHIESVWQVGFWENIDQVPDRIKKEFFQ